MKMVLYLFKLMLSLPTAQQRIVLAESASVALDHISKNADFRKDTQITAARLDIDTDVETPTIVRPTKSLIGTYNELKEIISQLDEVQVKQ